MARPLDGIRVIEISQFICGPYCTQILSDLGAEIIKVELPNGDISRRHGIKKEGTISTTYLNFNRGKKSIVLNLDVYDDRKTLKDLIQSADILVEDGSMLSNKDVVGMCKNLKNKDYLLHLEINGYGNVREFENYDDQDAIIQALSGFMSITGENANYHTKAGVPIADIYTGLYGAIALLAGIIYQKKNKKGMHIEVSKLSVMLTMMPDSMTRYLNTGIITRAQGVRHAMVGFFDLLKAKDGSVICMACQDFQFKAMLDVIGLNGLEKDKRFNDMTKRQIHAVELKKILDEKTIEFTMDELAEALLQKNLPIGSVEPLEKVLDGELVKYHKLLRKIKDFRGTEYRVVGSPIKFENIEEPSNSFVSELGEYTEKIKRDLKESVDDKMSKKLKSSEKVFDSENKPLKGIRILDLTRFMAGPLGTQILGQLGAEVIKVEKGNRLKNLTADTEPTRATAPAFGTTSTYFMALNAGKKDIVLDYTNPEHLKKFYELVKKVDIIVENFRPNVTEKLHIAYKDIKKYNPEIIYSNVSGFGYTGPYRSRGCVDTIAQAMSGFMDITGREDGDPVRGGSSIADICASLYETIGVLARIIYRDRTGAGGFVEVPMINAMLTVSDGGTAEYLNYGTLIKRTGNRNRMQFFNQTVPTANGWLMVDISKENHFKHFIQLLNLEGILNDNRFATEKGRRKYFSDLEEIIFAVTRTRTKEELQKVCCLADIPAGAVNTQEEILRSGYPEHWGLLNWVKDEKEGVFKVLGLPVKFDGFEIADTNTVPQPGENTKEIFKELLEIEEQQVEELYCE